MAKETKDVVEIVESVESVDTVKETMIPASQVADIVRAELSRILEAQNKQEEVSDSDEKTKVRVSRFDNKWVVDYEDKNNDPYRKSKMFEFPARNEFTGQVESHVTLVFADGSKKDVPFLTYLRNRVQIKLDLEERIETKSEKVVGTVTVKEVRGNNTYDTGREVKQIVSGKTTKFKVNLEGVGEVVLPEYMIN